jgi:hypothetical protein
MAGELDVRAFLFFPFIVPLPLLFAADEVDASGGPSGKSSSGSPSEESSSRGGGGSFGCRRVKRGLSEGGGVGSGSETSKTRFRFPFFTADSVSTGAAASLLFEVEAAEDSA